MADQELLETYLLSEEPDKLFASSRDVTGEFFVEMLEVEIPYSDGDMNEIQAIQDALYQRGQAVSSGQYRGAKSLEKYERFMQLHNHELAHFYQVLALPSFQMIWTTRNNFLKYEAVVMLAYFEQGGSYLGAEHRQLMAVLQTGNSFIPDIPEDQTDAMLNDWLLYVRGFREKTQGISFFSIIEGMAHIMSLQLSDKPEEDVLGLSATPEYSVAFECFESCLGSEILELRWKYLLFIYICYFAGQVAIPRESKNILAPAQCFLWLCKRAPEYVAAMKKLRQRYERYSLPELRKLLRWGIPQEDIEQASKEQISSLYAFFDFIEILKDEVESKFALFEEAEIEGLRDYIQVSKKLNIDWKNPFTLAKMMVFPANFVWTRQVYDQVKEMKSCDKEFTYSQEAMFYRFVIHCKNLLDPSQNALCCEEHGVVKNKKKLLYCKNRDSLASYLQQMFDRPAYELFRL